MCTTKVSQNKVPMIKCILRNLKQVQQIQQITMAALTRASAPCAATRPAAALWRPDLFGLQEFLQGIPS